MFKFIYRKIKDVLLFKKGESNFSYLGTAVETRGLTLVELLVVISIFLVITSTVLFNYGGFRSNISLQNLTDDIALAIRKSQSFAIGARGFGSTFSNSYGMHFSSNPSSANLTASNKSFLMFSAVNTDKRYIVGTGVCGSNDGSNKCMELFNITSADMIKEISLNDGAQTLSNSDYLDIIFTRPDPRAFFCYRTSINGACQVMTISNISIKISNGQIGTEEKTKTISVQNTGQISMQ